MDNKTGGEIGLKTIFGYIFGALFLLCFIIIGIETIKAGQIFIGILYLALSILVLVPHHFIRVTQLLKYVIIIILFLIVAGISGRNTPQRNKNMKILI